MKSPEDPGLVAIKKNRYIFDHTAISVARPLQLGAIQPKSHGVELPHERLAA